VALESGDELGGGRVPQFDLVVRPGRGQELPVRAERHRPDCQGIRLETGTLLRLLRQAAARAEGDRGHQDEPAEQRRSFHFVSPERAEEANRELSRLLVGMHDYGSGLDRDRFHVAADFAVDGTLAGTDLTPRFKEKTQGVWGLKLAR